jgi:hypothetical protein
VHDARQISSGARSSSSVGHKAPDHADAAPRGTFEPRADAGVVAADGGGDAAAARREQGAQCRKTRDLDTSLAPTSDIDGLRVASATAPGMCVALIGRRGKRTSSLEQEANAVNRIIYIIGLIVVVVAVLSWLGLR